MPRSPEQIQGESRTPDTAVADGAAGCVSVFDPDGVLEPLEPVLVGWGYQPIRHRAVSSVVPSVARGVADAVIVGTAVDRAETGRLFDLFSGSHLLHVCPIVVLAPGEAGPASATRFVEMGADAVIPAADDDTSGHALLRATLQSLIGKSRRRATEGRAASDRLTQAQSWLTKVLDQVIPLGAAATRTPDLNALLERIVVEAMDVSAADGGTLYLRGADECLSFAIMRCRSLGLAGGGTTGTPITIPALPLRDPVTAAPNHRTVATHAAITGNSVNVRDVYLAEDHDFAGAKAFDARTGYRTKSVLTVPLRDGMGWVAGVLQLINAVHPGTGAVVPFAPEVQRVTESLAVLAAAVLSSYVREQRLRDQVRALRIEVDESHKVKQVAEITTTDYFKELQKRAGEFRRRASTGSS
ncbi:MAG: GAF domain-containing protein [Phycisphaerae bacterium]|nr:GAF domain-containing protein [Tepidisphaeraceae bacterium]